MISRKLLNLGKPSLLILCAVVLSFSASRATSANPRIATKLNTIVRDSNAVLNTREAKRNLLRMISRKAKTNSKVVYLPAGCRCALAVEDAVGFRQCFTDCLDRAGISLIQLAACAGSCGASLVACAVCLGVSEWVVLGCGQYCAWNKIIAREVNDVRLRHPPSRNRGSQQARLGLKRIPAGT